jgi:hypothetical protein
MTASLRKRPQVRTASTEHTPPGVIPAPEPGSCNNSTVNNFNTPAPHIRGNDITDGGEPLLQVIGAGAAVTGLGFDILPEREPPVIYRLIANLQVEARL